MIQDILHKYGTVSSPSAEVKSIKDLQFRYMGLYFTADWCGSCVRSSPALKKIVEKIEEIHPGAFKLLTIRLD